ncbi:MAG: hypothetical protein GQ574_25585 [Crocinitomix sp.]|nr:hypothetical protein [Crocinitomix sp.]
MNLKHLLFVSLIGIICGCTDTTEETINNAIASNERSENEAINPENSESLSENQCPEDEIALDMSIVTNFYNFESLVELTLEEWTGYYSGFSTSPDFPCIVYDPTIDSLLVSSKRVQKKFSIQNVTIALNFYKSELMSSGFIGDEEEIETTDNSENGKLSISSSLLHILDNVNTASAYTYFSGIGENEFDYPLIYACDKSYDPNLILMGENGLNNIYKIELIDSAFNVYENYLNTRISETEIE